jgi:hypothetical protein
MMLASAMDPACLTEDGDCQRNLHLSEDGGVTFRLIHSYVVQFAWAHSLSEKQKEGPCCAVV